MKRYNALVMGMVIAIAVYGCSKTRHEKDVIRINNFQMTTAEFDELFKEAPASLLSWERQPRAKLLENLINRKLILQEAERSGLNQDREFLKSIERFYEQTLLKIVVDKKSNEFASQTQVFENEIEEYYNNMLKKGLASKPLSEVYKEIKWQLTRQKQNQAFEYWVEGLHRKASIAIDKKALGIEEEQKEGENGNQGK